MRLHKSEVADWEDLAPGQMNSWQRLADRTGGVATLGNVISVAGAAIVSYGLYFLTRRHLTIGIILVLIGRLADVLDGMVAESTGTKSPLGEAVDAAIDKLILAAALIIMLGEQLLPFVVGLIMLFHTGYNSAVSLIAKAKRQPITLHPSFSGKLSAVFEWLSAGLYVLAVEAKSHDSVAHHASLVAASLSFAIFVGLASFASADYSRQFKQAAKKI
jgi:CDP-diacylglycerol--glycerol-3-phosphate 3-phosphatidyltransferase